MMFNMAGNKKCHQHLAQREIVYFVSFIFQTQFHVKHSSWAEETAQRKTVKNVLHIFARLVHHSAVGAEVLENMIIPIFQRVEQNLDTNSAYAKDLLYINMKLNNSFGRTSPQSQVNVAVRRRSRADDGDASPAAEHRLSANNTTALLESYV